jgi:hypothetical protein
LARSSRLSVAPLGRYRSYPNNADSEQRGADE